MYHCFQDWCESISRCMCVKLITINCNYLKVISRHAIIVTSLAKSISFKKKTSSGNTGPDVTGSCRTGWRLQMECALTHGKTKASRSCSKTGSIVNLWAITAWQHKHTHNKPCIRAHIHREPAVTWQIIVSEVITRGVKSALIVGSIQDAAPMMSGLLHKNPSL